MDRLSSCPTLSLHLNLTTLLPQQEKQTFAYRVSSCLDSPSLKFKFKAALNFRNSGVSKQKETVTIDTL